jgi:hypothetical protein
MRKLVVAALIGVLTLAGAVAASAVSSSETVTDSQFTPGNKREGTRKNPRPNSFTLRHDQSTTTGSGQPETTATIRLFVPRGWILLSERWPRSRRCDINRVNQAGSDRVCPRGSRVGQGVVNLLGSDGRIQEVADLRVHVTRTGDLMIFLQTRPGEEVPLNTALLCAVAGRVANCQIPETLQRPLGVKSAIDNLRITIGGFTRIRGKRRGILETTSCRRFWVFQIEIVFDDGARQRDTDRVRC